MKETHEGVERYFAAWNETDPARRRELIARTWTEDGTYVDPLVAAAGHDAIDATIAAAQVQFPGFVFRLAGPIDAHHNLARFTWELAPRDGADALVVGSDVAVLDGEGRMTAVHGFLDKVPAEV
jgi:hypothetical protein